MSSLFGPRRTMIQPALNHDSVRAEQRRHLLLQRIPLCSLWQFVSRIHIDTYFWTVNSSFFVNNQVYSCTFSLYALAELKYRGLAEWKMSAKVSAKCKNKDKAQEWVQKWAKWVTFLLSCTLHSLFHSLFTHVTIRNTARNSRRVKKCTQKSIKN